MVRRKSCAPFFLPGESVLRWKPQCRPFLHNMGFYAICSVNHVCLYSDLPACYSFKVFCEEFHEARSSCHRRERRNMCVQAESKSEDRIDRCLLFHVLRSCNCNRQGGGVNSKSISHCRNKRNNSSGIRACSKAQNRRDL